MAEDAKSKRGRPSKFGRAMTKSERYEMARAKSDALDEAMKEEGYFPTIVYTHPKQERALRLLWESMRQSVDERVRNIMPPLPSVTDMQREVFLSQEIYRALYAYIKKQASELKDDAPFAEEIKALKVPELPLHQAAEKNAKLRFLQIVKEKLLSSGDRNHGHHDL